MPSFNRTCIKLKGRAKERYQAFFCTSQGLVYTITIFNGGQLFLTNSKTHSSFLSLTIYSEQFTQFTQFEIGSVTHNPWAFPYS